MFDIDFSPEATEDLAWFRKYAQTRIIDEVQNQLEHQPDVRTKSESR
jgi:hypothetical protein